MKFTVSTESDDGLSDYIKSVLLNNDKLEVLAKKIKDSKTYEQIKGIHKLCQLLIPRMTESYGQGFDLDGVKLAIKLHLEFTRKANDSEVLTEAINRKQTLKAMGLKTTPEDFQSMIVSLKKDLTKPKSFAEATKEEMVELINKIHLLAEKMDWAEVRLASNDMQSLLNSYSNN